MKKLLKYVVPLPAIPADKLVSKQVFQVFSGGEFLSAADLDPSVTAVEFEVPSIGDPPAEARIELQHFDDVDNPSPTKSESFSPVDTIGPEEPGDFGELTLKGDRVVEDDVLPQGPAPVAL